MEKITGKTFNEERALFSSKDLIIEDCSFIEGESPLKESSNIQLYNSTFSWKYPLWYSKDILVKDCTLEESARSGIWYTENITIDNTKIDAPKTFRNSKNIKINSCHMLNAKETMWGCSLIRLNSVTIKGDYFGAHSEDVEANSITIDGNYCFDSCKKVTIRNSYLKSKDSFWNCENVTLINCTIIGEYIGWNTKNMTLINCKIESHQGFCYIDGLKMYSCEIYHSDLIFEYCKNIDVEVTTVVDSIKNPINGQIVIKGVKELILDRKYIDPSKTKIIRR